MTKVKWKVEGMPQLLKSIKRLGKVPQKHVTASAKKGMNISLKESRTNAPYDIGMLKKGIVLKGERSRLKAKKVYRIVFDEAMNDVFQKPIQKPGSRGAPKPQSTGYYPISQEYGYYAGDGNYIPGFRFISDSLINNVSSIEKTMVSEMKKRIDSEIAKVGLR